MYICVYVYIYMFIHVYVCVNMRFYVCVYIYIFVMLFSVPVMRLHLSPPPADRLRPSESFNVGTAGAKIFSGLAEEEFGYAVQQATNHEGKWC